MGDVKVTPNVISDHHIVQYKICGSQAKISQPWLDEKIQDLRRKREALERQWEKSGLEIYKQMYQDQTKIVSEAIQAAKFKYYTESLSIADIRTTLEILNSLQHKGQKKLPKLDTDQAICDAFSTFFISKIYNILDSFRSSVTLSTSQ